MKTRREFFKTLAGSMAVVAACVIAPQSLMGKEEYPWRSMSDTIGGKYVPVLETAGYASVEERLDNIDSWITITETGEGLSQKRSSQEYHYVTKFVSQGT